MLDIGFSESDKPLVLVVDDESALQAVIFDVLDGWYRLDSASNGRDGIAKAAKIKPDLILMDVMMPDMGGYEAARALYKDPSTNKLPIVIMTASSFDDSTIQMLKNEPNIVGFLKKPFKPNDLRDIVKKNLENKK